MFATPARVLDCTIRDGGLLNGWQFSEELVRKVLRTLARSGVDTMEIGYRSSPRYFAPSEYGPWKFCDDADLRRVVEGSTVGIKLSAMADVGRVDPVDIGPSSESPLQMIRVACYAHQVAEGIALCDHCAERGYETTLNLMAVSTVSEGALDLALEALARSSVPAVYLVDSYGALTPGQVRGLTRKYAAALPGKALGVHAHNNLQLAFANTLEAASAGATLLDATVFGMGRGAGNCPLELLLAHLRGPTADLGPLLDLIQDDFIPLQRRLAWGYHPATMITGALNQHPRRGMEALAAETLPRLAELYGRATQEAGHRPGGRRTKE